ncbi:CidA/LrgA family protein [Alkalicoccobacillus gibsonii]|jgi:holin-like protein|uniref:CidA/LrgA family protein n=1 Tax=Alkalicoccobacillus gibsonii TaxID=79881 RepID=A0ABU9VMP4_9BACI|nr:CidA/LrgA family protein [Alkalicoccobacillus gibsonii]MBM0067045.1 CidA/LrgA family protein [Alkalicoccobacillus gibsonii]
MRIIARMAIHLLILSGFYLLGLGLQSWLSIPFPGSLIGMLLLLVCLISGVIPERFVDLGASYLLKHLSLLFVPIIAGVVVFPILFTRHGLILILITMFSTMMIIIVSGLVSQSFARKQERKS